jgi:hypothetical protein
LKNRSEIKESEKITTNPNRLFLLTLQRLIDIPGGIKPMIFLQHTVFNQSAFGGMTDFLPTKHHLSDLVEKPTFWIVCCYHWQ